MEDPPAWALALLRRFRPVQTVGPVTVATRADDVVAVLRDEQKFQVRRYGRTMSELAGPFALGLDGPEHAAARRVLEAALVPIEPAALQAWADDVARRLVATRCRDGKLDVVADLAERLPARFAADHLGVPGLDDDALIRWSKTLFEGIFLNFSEHRSLAAEAEEASELLQAHIDGLLAQARTEARPSPGTVLDRLLHAAGSSEASGADILIRANLVGLVVGSVAPVSEAISRAVDHLLGSAGAFAGARSAAERGDHAMLWRYVREALRFAPQSPGLVREVVRPTRLGTPPHDRVVDVGDVLFVSTVSAMRDPATVKQPKRFRMDRPDDTYLHFGAGPHRCLGERIAPVLMTAAIAALFRHRGLRRVPGRSGRLAIEGRWPAHLTVAL
jgi:cytochrome P450